MNLRTEKKLNKSHIARETKNNIPDNLSGPYLIDGLSILAIQLFSYSSYLLEKLDFEIIMGKNSISMELFLNSKMSAQHVKQEIEKVLEQEKCFRESARYLRLIWHFERSDQKEEYRIELKYGRNGVSVSYDCKQDSLFHSILRNGTCHFANINKWYSENPSLPVVNYSYLTEKEKEQIESLSYGPYYPESDLSESASYIFESIAGKYPDNKCIKSQQGVFTYQEINEKSNQLAHYLYDNGLCEGSVAAILMHRSADLYVAMMAVLKTGAAYLPIDISYPHDRIKYILNDSGAQCIISISSYSNLYSGSDKPAFCFDESLIPVFLKEDKENLNINISGTSPAYIIYTSGTTGLPKGVEISHGALYNLIEGEKRLYVLTEKENIAQTFSPAFDASLEEIWMAFSTGSCLYPVSETILHSGEELESFVIRNNISVLSTVPTMLLMMHPPLSSLRLLILGGEVCPDELVKLWSSDGLTIYNTYGPTEATVISTYDRYEPDSKITIGKPLSNYSVFILNQGLQQVPAGIAGELCIGGKSLATRYVNREEMTSLKFVNPPFRIINNFPQRIYRTGDLARFNSEGKIEFLGRIDSQVKLRGFRIELGEIESQLKLQPEIRNAVVLVRTDNFNTQRLVAYIVPKNISVQINEMSLKNRLKEKLAGFMIPSVFIVLPELPTLPSGKTDIRKLPEITDIIKANGHEVILPENDTQKSIYAIWKEKFAPVEVSVTDDFFDLGGHSLLASLVVSEMRKNEISKSVSVKDIYQYRTIKALADFLNTSQKSIKNEKEKVIKPNPVDDKTYIKNSILQGISVYFILLVTSIGLISPFAIGKLYPDISPYGLIFYSSMLVITTLLAFLIFSILLKWTIIGKFKPGVYPLWGNYYFRFWIIKKFVDMASTSFLAGTPFLNMYFRLLGAKIGKKVYLGTDRIRIFDLIQIGNNSSITKEANLMGYEVRDGALIIGNIKIGENCYIGTRSVVSYNSEMKDNSSLGELSLLTEREIIPAGEHWEGSPAAKVENPKVFEFRTSKKIKALPYHVYLFYQFIGVMFFFLFPLVLIVPFAITYYEIDLHWGFHWVIISTLPFTAVYIVCYCLFVSALKWILTGKMKEDEFSIYSFMYIRKWYIDLVVQETLLVFRFIYATIITPVWLRMMGSKVGKAAEISTVNQISPDLLNIGNGSFLADSVSIGGPVVLNGIMFNRKTSVGDFTFIGNSAVLACGEKVGDNNLIGVLSVPPKNLNKYFVNGSSWLGSPPMFLPVRQESAKFDEKFTFNPSTGLYFKRAFVEFFKITLPLSILSIILCFFYKLIYDIFNLEDYKTVLFLSPLILFASFGITPFIAFVFKKLLIGTYRKSNHPLWSWFVWKNELINAICESLVYPVFLNILLGTPFVSWFFRMMGCKIGKKVYFETSEITEFDLVNIGDNTCLNYLCTIQTHLFEDRVMKMSDLVIQNNCTLGAMSVILYDATMMSGSSVYPLSLIMKGETIPSETKWVGSPVKSVSGA